MEPETHGYEAAAILGALYGEGIAALPGAFPRSMVGELREDIDALFQEALRQPKGALPRGPHRYYVEIHPERIRCFVQLVTHPWVQAVCEAVLGPDYKLVEIGFDVPEPGAQTQPWHRDFPAPDATVKGRRLNSLAFNMTTVDVWEDMGPLEIAPGTQWDVSPSFEDGMFPPKSLYPRYQQRAQRKLPKMGDISARSALTIHRGTANKSQKSRPTLVMGFDAPDGRNAERHDLQLSARYVETLSDDLRRHMAYRRVTEREPIVQAHTIQRLVDAGD